MDVVNSARNPFDNSLAAVDVTDERRRAGLFFPNIGITGIRLKGVPFKEPVSSVHVFPIPSYGDGTRGAELTEVFSGVPLVGQYFVDYNEPEQGHATCIIWMHSSANLNWFSVDYKKEGDGNTVENITQIAKGVLRGSSKIKNYVINSNAENDSRNISNSAAGALTVERNETPAEVLAGDASFKISSATAADTEYVAVELYPIDREDLESELDIELSYEELTAVALELLEIVVYDIDNTTNLPVTDSLIPAGGPGKHKATVDLTGASQNLELRLRNNQDATSFDIAIDSIRLGPTIGGTSSSGGGGGGGGGFTNMATITASGVWVVPVEAQKIVKVKVIGGGGGGGGDDAVNSTTVWSGGGGGAGGCAEGYVDLTGVPSVNVTIGGGGGPGAVNASGGAGGSTSFGAFMSATGGGAGNHHGEGGLGGIGSGGDLNYSLGDGEPGGSSPSPSASNQGQGGSGGGTGGGRGRGRDYFLNQSSAGSGRAPGAGGGGSCALQFQSFTAPGSGAAGIVIVEY